MVTALTFLIILIILVVIHELGHFFAAKKNDVYVEEFGVGFPPKAFGKKLGETVYTVNWLPLGGFVKLYGEEYHEEGKLEKKPKIPTSRAFVNKKPWQKTIIIVAGVLMNFVLGWVIISYLFTSGIPMPTGVSIVEVQPNSPAAQAQLQKNDQLVSISKDNTVIEISTTYELIRATKQFSGEIVDITINRNGTEQTVQLEARENPPANQGAFGIVINQNVEEKKYPWYTAPFYGLERAFTMTRMIAVEILKIPYQLITQQKTDVEFSGPVGIAKVVGEARAYGIKPLLEIMALLSLNLAVINILPFPALDGGRLVFILYEWVSGRRPNQNFEKYMNLVGIIILLSLSAWVTVYDILKLF
ncbi:MAG TPA: M50 family metallopeptidase [Candidatus Woesebacteria bacterium]|nr:M50 family metallopeptidase [Candidatus Woesebacteria bacterium]